MESIRGNKFKKMHSRVQSNYSHKPIVYQIESNVSENEEEAYAKKCPRRYDIEFG